MPKAGHIEARQEVAWLAGVGARNVSSVKIILDKAHERLIDALHNGTLSIYRAVQLCNLPCAQQLEQFISDEQERALLDVLEGNLEVNNQMSGLPQNESNTNDKQELSNLIEDTGEELAEEYYSNAQTFLDQLGLFDCNNHPVNPLEVWKGIAQAIADYSGFRVVLEAAILEPTTEEPNRFTVIGHRQIATADPTVWVKEA